MRMDKFTTMFQQSLAEAQSLALGKDNQFIEAEHVLKVMLNQDNGTVLPLLHKIGANVAKIIDEADKAIAALPAVQGQAGEVFVSTELGRILNITDKIAQQRKDQYISSELFLLEIGRAHV